MKKSRHKLHILGKDEFLKPSSFFLQLLLFMLNLDICYIVKGMPVYASNIALTAPQINSWLTFHIFLFEKETFLESQTVSINSSPKICSKCKILNGFLIKSSLDYWLFLLCKLIQIHVFSKYIEKASLLQLNYFYIIALCIWLYHF